MDVISLISKNPSFPDGEVTGAYGDFGDLTPYCENGPRVHEYLQEMNDKVLSKYDIMTVGETPNASVDDAAKFANCDGTELNMVFQFEHVSIDYGQFGKYTENRYRLKDLIAVLSKWQDGLCDKAGTVYTGRIMTSPAPLLDSVMFQRRCIGKNRGRCWQPACICYRGHPIYTRGRKLG